jgi:hypothetical protein
MKRFLLVIAVLISALPYSRAQSAEVTGIVRDDVGAVQPHAAVQMRRAGPYERVASTDVKGQFQFAQLPAGSYEFRVTAACFKIYKKSLILDSNSKLALEVTLTRAGTTCTGID